VIWKGKIQTVHKRSNLTFLVVCVVLCIHLTLCAVVGVQTPGRTGGIPTNLGDDSEVGLGCGVVPRQPSRLGIMGLYMCLLCRINRNLVGYSKGRR
jgi:hypothetical protein